jgi:chromosome segregation ATPase
MEMGQLTQLTTWLDEEQRRSKAEIIQLQQQLTNQGGELQDQARTLKDLEGRVAAMQSQMLNLTQFQTALQQLKEEVVQLLAQADDRRQKDTREAERLRAVERDNVSRALNELRRDLQRLPRIEEETSLRKAEQQRVGESMLNIQQTVNTLNKEVENKLRTIPFLEDGRQQDAKRIAQLQQESLEAMKRLEQHTSRLQVLDDMVQRQERDTGELKELFSQLRTSQREFVERQLLEIEKIKRQMAEWFERLEVYTKRIDDFAARMKGFSDEFREDRQVVGNIERFQEQIRREQTQVGELQRLAEERQRRQLDEWQEESEKRWRKELLRWDHEWGEQAKRNGQIADTFAEIESRLAQHRAEIDAAWRFFQSQIDYQTQESRRWLGEMTRIVEERPKKE